MTLITGTVQALGYEPLSGTLNARPARFRADGGVIFAPERKPYKITAGQVSVELAPGPAKLELKVGAHATGDWDVVIPDQESISLADLLDTVFPWEPEQVSKFVAERLAAEQAKGDAQAAKGDAEQARTDTQLLAQQTSQDRTAVADDKAVVVGHVQALAAPNDAAVLGLISEGATTQTKAALNATYVRMVMPESFGAVGDGTTDDSAAVQAAINAAPGGIVILRTMYNATGIVSAANGTTIIGIGRGKSGLHSSTGDVLTLSGVYVTIENVSINSNVGGGHCVVIPPNANLAQSRISHCMFRQNNPSKNVWRMHAEQGQSAGMFDVHWIDCLFRHHAEMTVPGFYAYSANGNSFSANRFTRCRAHSSAGAPFFDITLDSSGTFHYNNAFSSINFEVCNGGGIRMRGANNTGIHDVGFFDNGTITAPLIEFGRLGSNNQSRGNRITNYHRSGGTLSGGAVDIRLTSGQNSGSTLMEGISGTSTAGVTIDLGSGSGYGMVVGYDPSFVTILNAHAERSVLLNTVSGLTTPGAAITNLTVTNLTVGGVSYLTGTANPEGAVTATAGALYIRTAGSGVPRLYVKEMGTNTNTGWRPANAPHTRTTAQLVAATDNINTEGKTLGRMVWNSTTGRPVYASGTTATSPWVDATGATVHTPA